ncbi:hypothetical protein ACYCEJ_002823 [Enterobacter hormaechei]
MKPIKRLYLSTDEIHLADASLVLELNSSGRGFITAGTTQDYTGKAGFFMPFIPRRGYLFSYLLSS